MVEPAFITQPNGEDKARFIGLREDIVMDVIQKLSVEQGYFFNDGGPNDATDNFVLQTSLYAISQELKRRGKEKGRSGGKKAKSYSYDQIREALTILSKVKLHIKSESNNDDDIIVSAISDFGYYKMSKAKQGTKTYQDQPVDATIYIGLNKLMSKAILQRNWRPLNYIKLMNTKSFLGRWFRKRLSHRYTYADAAKSWHILLSNVIESS